ncbi:MAG: hypothetical protein V1817_03500 [Candidatus Micrarchaeota archaeon]
MSILEKKNSRQNSGQVSFEYLLLIAGGLVILVLLVFLLRSDLFGPAQLDITNRSGEIHSALASIMPPSG